MRLFAGNNNEFEENKKIEGGASGFWIVAGCLIIKTLLFYNLMDIRTNLLFLWIVTSVILLLLFGCFRRWWIPYILYIALTLLMFSDVTFNAYFNGYISINSLGSAKYLPEVWGVIRQVIKPEFWGLFVDLPILAIALPKAHLIRKWKRWPRAMLMVWIIIFMVMGSISLSSFLRSAGNLEFFSAHIIDILNEKIGFARPCFDDMEGDPYTVDQSREDALFGIAEGKNLIVIQMEALQNFVIDKDYNGSEITPVLNQLIRDSGTIYFNNYYMQIASGNTSDAEFATNNSVYGSEKSYTYELFKGNTFRGLPVLLKERGYSTIAMHGYEGSFWSRLDMYPAQGFDTFIDGTGYEPTVVHGWGIIDEEFYRQSVNYLKDQPQPFYNFMVSLSNHTPFKMDKELCRLMLSDKHKNTRFGDYLNSTAYSDYALGVLLDELKKAGLYENSVIAIYGDHFGLAQKDEDNGTLLTEFLGKPYRFDEMANIPLIIHIPGEEINETFTVAGGQIDFMPTIAYLLGFEELDTIYMGQNLITAKEGFVAQNRYAPLGSFIADETVFLMSGDKVFENGRAWRRDNGDELPLDGLRDLYERSVALIAASEKFLEDDPLAEESNLTVGEDVEKYE